CPLGVKSGHMQCTRPCPLYPRKRHQMRHMECLLWARSGHLCQLDQLTAAAILRLTSAMAPATSSAIFGPCVLISENSASEIRSRSPDLKLGHSRVNAHQFFTCG